MKQKERLGVLKFWLGVLNTTLHTFSDKKGG